MIQEEKDPLVVGRLNDAAAHWNKSRRDTVDRVELHAVRASHPTAERPPPRPRGEGVRGARANAFEESGADGAAGGGTNRARTKIPARLLVPTTPKVKDAPREAQAGPSREPQQLLHLYHKLAVNFNIQSRFRW